MKLIAEHQGKEHALELRQTGPGRYVCVAFGKEQPVSVTQHKDGTLSFAIGDDRFDAHIDPFDGGVQVDLGVTKIAITALTEREAQKRKLQEASGGSGDWLVKSPMPGKVVNVLVEAGATVKKGQGLVVIEAMKMENELRAPEAGVVAEICVKPGQTVEASAVLIRAASN